MAHSTGALCGTSYSTIPARDATWRPFSIRSSGPPWNTSAEAAAGPYIVMAIPLLVEGGARDRVDRVLVVDVDESVQLQRVMARDGCSLEQARAILGSQASRAARLAAADDVLLNSGTVTEVRQAVDRLHQSYLRLAET